MIRLKLFFSNVWDFLRPLVETFLSQAGQVLAASAMRAVLVVAASMSQADGSAKRAAAFDLILDDLRSRGLEIGDSVINCAIEAAVQRLKADG